MLLGSSDRGYAFLGHAVYLLHDWQAVRKVALLVDIHRRPVVYWCAAVFGLFPSNTGGGIECASELHRPRPRGDAHIRRNASRVAGSCLRNESTHRQAHPVRGGERRTDVHARLLCSLGSERVFAMQTHEREEAGRRADRQTSKTRQDWGTEISGDLLAFPALLRWCNNMMGVLRLSEPRSSPAETSGEYLLFILDIQYVLG